MTERVISTKVLGSADPISKKFRSIKSAIGGIGCGFILLIVSMVLVYLSVNGVKEYSKIVQALPMRSSTEAIANTELAKVSGSVTASMPVSLSYTKCQDKFCNPFYVTAQKIENLSYYEYEKQRFEVVKHVTQEHRTKDVGGQEVEETVEVTKYTEEWVTRESNKGFGSFTMATLNIQPNAGTKTMIDMNTQEVLEVKIDNAPAMDNYGQIPGPQVGSTKLVVKSIPVLTDKPLVVVGKVESNVIKSGDPFIITTSNEAKLLADLGQEETFQKVALLIAGWISMFIGLGLLIAPILELVNWIPLFGKAAKFAAGVISFIISTVVVLSSYLIIRFWYLCIVLVVALIVLAVVLISKKNKTAV
jgi:hypothetical protein